MLTDTYWDERYCQDNTPWDLGRPAPALLYLAERFASLESKILIPGAGTGLDLLELHRRGFLNTTALDWSSEVVNRIRQQAPNLPSNAVIQSDFFNHQSQYDVILEQTFFCALPPDRRTDYVDHVAELLHVGGLLAGVWFDFPLTEQGPPFGGNPAEYRQLLARKFNFIRFERCRLSVPERWGKEWLIVAHRT